MTCSCVDCYKCQNIFAQKNKIVNLKQRALKAVIRQDILRIIILKISWEIFIFHVIPKTVFYTISILLAIETDSINIKNFVLCFMKTYFNISVFSQKLM